MAYPIEFELFAPNAVSVALIGSFLDGSDRPMQKDDRGYFRTSIELEDGTYQYQFRVQIQDDQSEGDRQIEINDPYAKEINPATCVSVVRVHNGQRIVDTYQWQHGDRPLPANHELIIYELLVPDFAHPQQDPDQKGSYQDVIDKLDYLHDLGINAIELMPVNEAPGAFSWGYTPSYFFAPDPTYGSTADLKKLIDECHARGIRVILDQLYNHSSEANPLFKLDRTYWYYEGRHHPDAKPSDYWGPEFNYEYQDDRLGIRPAWQFMGDVVRYWVQQYHIDGIRYDALKELDNYDFLYWITQEIDQIKGEKPFYNIGEYIPEQPGLVRPSGPMDSTWHDSFQYFMSRHLTGETFELDQLQEVLKPTEQGYPDSIATVVNYLTSHDRDRTLKALGDRGIFDDAAFQRAKLGAAILMTAPGIPMIWMGEEFGMYTPSTPNQPHALEWELLKNDLNRDLLNYYKQLIALRKQHPALLTSNIDIFHEDPENKVFAYVRWNNEGSQVVVIVSFADRTLEGYQIHNFPAHESWQMWGSGEEVRSHNNQITLDLAPYEAHILASTSTS
ncbi:MAG TPA: alpha-amylase family glycosyl hydrolase [Microcoleaceae cyanobacterium]